MSDVKMGTNFFLNTDGYEVDSYSSYENNTTSDEIQIDFDDDHGNDNNDDDKNDSDDDNIDCDYHDDDDEDGKGICCVR